MDLDSTLRRVAKLLAIAADSRGDPNETAAAAQQAERIMRKFNLDHADVLAAGLRRAGEEAMGSVRVRANMKRDVEGRSILKRAPKWAGHIAFEVAMLHDAQVRYAWDVGMGGVVVEFCGVKEDAQVAAWMFDYLVGQMIAGVRSYSKGHRERYGHGPSKIASGGFRDGFVSSLLGALQRARREKEGELATHSAGAALVVLKAEAIKETFKDNFTYRDAKQKAVRAVDAFVEGMTAGAKVDVARRAVESSGGAAAAARVEG